MIGRENIATSKGAIIELVKNGYDADSKVSIVFFENKHSSFQAEISEEHFTELELMEVPTELLLRVYQKIDEGYKVRNDIADGVKAEFRKHISKLSTLYLIDSGEGMTQKIIRDHWMTIGTDNKATNIFTKSGRVKAGAKGIGRFALDKLGSKCEMVTLFNPENHEPDVDENVEQTSFTGYHWLVNWEDFEGDFKTIDSVNAELYGIIPQSLKEVLIDKVSEIDLSKIRQVIAVDWLIISLMLTFVNIPEKLSFRSLNIYWK